MPETVDIRGALQESRTQHGTQLLFFVCPAKDHRHLLTLSVTQGESFLRAYPPIFHYEKIDDSTIEIRDLDQLTPCESWKEAKTVMATLLDSVDKLQKVSL